MSTYLQQSIIFTGGFFAISLYLKYKNRNMKNEIYKIPYDLKPNINDWGFCCLKAATSVVTLKAFLKMSEKS